MGKSRWNFLEEQDKSSEDGDENSCDEEEENENEEEYSDEEVVEIKSHNNRKRNVKYSHIDDSKFYLYSIWYIAVKVEKCM